MTAMISDSSAGAHGRMTWPERSADAETMRGREPEQKLVRDLLRRAQRGTGGVLLVDGEPGIGKTLLLRHATDEAAKQGLSLAAGAADQLGQAIPFFALRAALREPFAELISDDPGHGLPAAAAWWITQIRAHLEQRAAASVAGLAQCRASRQTRTGAAAARCSRCARIWVIHHAAAAGRP